MNKPATKEPSMDEILSSIRQIIADDDAAAAPPANRAPAAARPPAQPSPAEPLALSPAQIISNPQYPAPAAMPAMDPMLDMPEGEPELVDTEDVAFEPEPEPEPEYEPEPPPPPAPMMRTAPMPAPPRPAPRPVAQAAPMPDPTLASDMAEQLLEPATAGAVHGTMARLSAIAAPASSQTIEGMMRELMRPMLKEWLDENLPSLVERVVEKEIARISRGGK